MHISNADVLHDICAKTIRFPYFSCVFACIVENNALVLCVTISSNGNFTSYPALVCILSRASFANLCPGHSLDSFCISSFSTRSV